MGRKKTVAPAEQVGQTFVGKTPAAMAEPEAQMHAAHRMVLDYEGVLRDLGRFDALEFLRRVGDVAIAQIFENVRNSGAYKGLPYINEQGEPSTIGDFQEFCEVKIGKSYSRCAELAQNLRALGPDLYEQSEKLGLRNIDYKALRALPADEQTLVKRAVEEAKTRDEVLDLLQELAAKHHREREEKDKQIADLTADSEATGRVLEEKNRKLDELAKKGRRKGADPWPEEVAGLKDDLHGLGKVLDEALGKHLTLIDATEAETDKHADGETNPDALAGYKTVVHHLGEQIERICTLAAGLRHEFDTRLAGYIDIDKSHALD